MSLPFELTKLPSNALDIIRYLGSLDSYAAFDVHISEALDLSERGFGKAIRRLVTQEYVEMQIDGTYILTQRGLDAAETLEAHDAEARHDSFDEDVIEDVPDHAAVRRLLVVYPKTLPVGGTAYVFVRVDAPTDAASTGGGEISCHLHGDVTVEPAQRDITIPADEASGAARFAVTPPGAGSFTARLEVFQVTQFDLMEAGACDLTLTADGAGSDVFRVETLDITLLAV